MTAGVLWGAQTNNTGPERFEALVGKKMSIYHGAAPMGRGYDAAGAPLYYGCPKASFAKWMAGGRLIMWDWGPWNATLRGDERFSLAAFARGDHDAFLTTWAQDAASVGPVMVRLGHEMNGAWEPWYDSTGGAAYVAMWRHIVDVFRQAGNSSATFLWCPNACSTNATASTFVDKLAGFYPGDDYVDWTGLDTYNWNTPWLTPTQILRGGVGGVANTYDKILSIAPSKPMVLAEWAAPVDPRKPAWLLDALSRFLADFPALRAVVWYDAVPTGSGVTWPLTIADSSAQAFAVGVKDQRYVAGGSFAMPTGKIVPVELPPITPPEYVARGWLTWDAAAAGLQISLTDARVLSDMLAERNTILSTSNTDLRATVDALSQENATLTTQGTALADRLRDVRQIATGIQANLRAVNAFAAADLGPA